MPVIHCFICRNHSHILSFLFQYQVSISKISFGKTFNFGSLKIIFWIIKLLSTICRSSLCCYINEGFHFLIDTETTVITQSTMFINFNILSISFGVAISWWILLDLIFNIIVNMFISWIFYNWGCILFHWNTTQKSALETCCHFLLWFT